MATDQDHDLVPLCRSALLVVTHAAPTCEFPPALHDICREIRTVLVI